jgi:hypothetical protein
MVQKFIRKVEVGTDSVRIHFIVDEEHYRRDGSGNLLSIDGSFSLTSGRPGGTHSPPPGARPSGAACAACVRRFMRRPSNPAPANGILFSKISEASQAMNSYKIPSAGGFLVTTPTLPTFSSGIFPTSSSHGWRPPQGGRAEPRRGVRKNP